MGGVGGEPAAGALVVAIGGADEAEGAVLDEVGERETAAAVALRDGDDEAEVGFDEPLPRLGVPDLDPSGQIQLLRRGEQADAAQRREESIEALDLVG